MLLMILTGNLISIAYFSGTLNYLLAEAGQIRGGGVKKLRLPIRLGRPRYAYLINATADIIVQARAFSAFHAVNGSLLPLYHTMPLHSFLLSALSVNININLVKLIRDARQTYKAGGLNNKIHKCQIPNRHYCYAT